MKNFAIFDKNVAAVFQLQLNIVNISDMFLQYSVLCEMISIRIQPRKVDDKTYKT